MNSSYKLSRSVEKQNTFSQVMMSYSDPGHESKLVHDGFYIDGNLYYGESAVLNETTESSCTKGGQNQSVY